MPRESPLQACVDAGALALPQLLKLSTVLQGKYTEAWEAGSVPLDLRDEVPGGGPGGGGPGGGVLGGGVLGEGPRGGSITPSSAAPSPKKRPRPITPQCSCRVVTCSHWDRLQSLDEARGASGSSAPIARVRAPRQWQRSSICEWGVETMSCFWDTDIRIRYFSKHLIPLCYVPRFLFVHEHNQHTTYVTVVRSKSS